MILIIDMCYEKDSLSKEEFVRPIIDIVKESHGYEVIHFTEHTEEHLEKATHIIMSGSALMDHTTLSHIEMFGWLKTINKPTLAICAGIQTLTKFFGGDTFPQLNLGMAHVMVKKTDPLFGDEKEFDAFELHTIGITCPSDFDVLAKADDRIQVIKHKDRPLYGFLFHPEARNPDILKRFLEL